MEFQSYNVPKLEPFLQERGVTCSFYNKEHLVKLCYLAKELNLEIIEQNIDRESELSSISRRTVNVNNDSTETVVLEKVDDISVWSSHLSSLPPLETADALVYLYDYCAWGSSRLKSYKTDNGFQLHLANHIGNVQISQQQNGAFMYVKSTCVPETRQNDKPYKVWILLKNSGEVVSGGCTCVVDSGACKHCVALLFSLVSFSDRYKDRFTEACTDIGCVWDKPKKATEPMEIDEIDIRRDTSETSIKKPTPDCKTYVPSCSFSRENVEKELCELFKNTDSLVLQILDESSDESDKECDASCIPTMSEALSSLSEKANINGHLQNIYSDEIINEIENCTQGQSDNEEWFAHRQGRITASLFHSVSNFRYNDKPNNYILKKVMGNEKNVLYPSLAHGKKYEAVARQQYIDQCKKLHKNFVVRECGLFVDKKHPFMGASPDGIVTCTCCGKGLLEIKCSYMHQNVTPHEACLDDHYHIYCDENNQVKLKESSSWYLQIQGQMGVCELKWCDFVFFTRKGISVDRIHYDHDIFSGIVLKCDKFFNKYGVDALIQNCMPAKE
ncbi:hypothetical protein FSP39_022335 [Pinctada imbricata]|uniref:SWIM-type domain-containing protein n=1 Tax=Pinctada imbricata TaxID=66713 RepID=A0AA88XSJ1_PINIB|nr:hypothetical protein FSP39_022335 [Pinctada imbricata]